MTTPEQSWFGRGRVLTHQGRAPRIGERVFIADGGLVIGDTVLGDEVTVWFNAVIRGDVNAIRIGPRTNIQDLTMCHVTMGAFPLHIGADVTIGHAATVHGCTIGDRVLVGMGATILDGAVIEDDVLIGAGALVPPGAHIPRGTLALGTPARVRRDLTDADRMEIMASARHYVQAAQSYGPCPGKGW